jgi:hypothetical protein
MFKFAKSDDTVKTPLTDEEKAERIAKIKHIAKATVLIAAVPAAIIIAKKVYDNVRAETAETEA